MSRRFRTERVGLVVGQRCICLSSDNRYLTVERRLPRRGSVTPVMIREDSVCWVAVDGYVSPTSHGVETVRSWRGSTCTGLALVALAARHSRVPLTQAVRHLQICRIGVYPLYGGAKEPI